MIGEYLARVRAQGWMGGWLLAAALYNLAWGALVVSFPFAPFHWAGMEPPNYPEIWQCLGMVIGVYGLLYALAAADPIGQWPVVAVGLLGKLLGPIGFLHAALEGNLPWVAGLTLLTNDLIWWIPFTLILRRAWIERRRPPVRAAAAVAVSPAAHGDGDA
jgi:small multidrug resistance pump